MDGVADRRRFGVDRAARRGWWRCGKGSKSGGGGGPGGGPGRGLRLKEAAAAAALGALGASMTLVSGLRHTLDSTLGPSYC